MVGADSYTAGTVFKSEVGGGEIVFNFDFTGDTNYTSNNHIVFDNFTRARNLGTLGIRAPANVDLTILTYNAGLLNVTASTGSIRWFSIYVPDRDAPADVLNGIWYKSGDYVNITASSNTTVSVIWGVSMVYDEASGEYLPNANTQDLSELYLLTGDYAGFVIASYAQVVGVMFFGFALTYVSIPVYRRSASVFPVAVLWALGWGLFNRYIPPQGLNLAVVLMMGSIGIVIAILVVGRVRRYG